MKMFFEVKDWFVIDLTRVISCFIEHEKENTKEPWRILFLVSADPYDQTRCISVNYKRKRDAESAFSMIIGRLQEINLND